MADTITTTVDTKTLEELQPVAVVKEVATVEPTPAVVEQAIELLKEVEKNGGYGDIAGAIGFDKITKSQVKRIHRTMFEKISELTPVIDPILETPITK